MSDSPYTPAKVWQWTAANGGKFANINRPTAGASHQTTLPVGQHGLQLYSLATPNGVKVTIMLEELIEMGKGAAEYDAYLINIGEGDQFGNEFVDINPNSKIPALLDLSTTPATRIFESGSILFYLAEKFNALLPADPRERTECMSWLFWQMGSAPYLGGGFGHFYSYAPLKIEYCIDRFSMEVKRQLDVLDQHLSTHHFMSGDHYSIADIAIYSWYGTLVIGELYEAQEFLEVASYRHIVSWAKKIEARPAVKRGSRVNKTWGDEELQMPERHSTADF